MTTVRSTDGSKLKNQKINTRLRKRVLEVLNGGYLVRFKPKHAVEGFAILLYNGQVSVVGKNTYVVGPEHLTLLDKAGVSYEIIEK